MARQVGVASAQASTAVFVFTKYDAQGASSRYRFYQYFPAARAAGLDIRIFPLFDAAYLETKYRLGRSPTLQVARAILARLLHLWRVPRGATVLIEYELLPYLPAWGERWLAWRGCRLIVDYDDAIFHQYDLHPRWLVRRLLGRKIASVMRCASQVTAGNAYLADYAMRRAGKVAMVVPTVVDLARYPVPRVPSPHESFTIVWIGSPSTARYMRMIAEPLAQFCQRADVRLVLIGSGEIDLPGVHAEILSWHEDTEFADICRGDVGIMPLTDDPWSRGKCGFKLIQYMACGLPVIASPVGVNATLVAPGINGFLADDDASWLHALEMLRADRDMAARMGGAGRACVESTFNLATTAPLLVSLWSDTAEAARS